jgi:phosphate transport system substrate-binding protein
LRRLFIGLWAVAALLSLAACGAKTMQVWEQLRIVGSTSVTDYGNAVADQLVTQQPKLKLPVIEPTGTGEGLKQFCRAIGGSSPDLTFASRRMKRAEYDACVANGVKDTIEFQIGMDAVVLVQSRKGPVWQLSRRDLYAAVASLPFGRGNRARKWHQVNPALPEVPIQFYAPSAKSGSRSAFADLMLKPPCEADPKIKAVSDKEARERFCTTLREDGLFINVGANADLMRAKLAASPGALGLLSYAYAMEHQDELRIISIDGVLPSEATIQTGTYPGSRPLYAYVKRAHLEGVPGLREYTAMLQHESEPGGLLMESGLILASAEVRANSAQVVQSMQPLDPATLK